MTDYEKFKRLLAWFVNQLNINNGVIDGKITTGYGYKENSSLRDIYNGWRSYTDFDLDCTIAHKYGNYATASNYINLAGTDFNTIPEFDNESKAVVSFYIGNHPSVSGMLLYPWVDEDMKNPPYSMDGNNVFVRTVDLNQEFTIIGNELMEIYACTNV